jgi:hypothetical protein
VSHLDKVFRKLLMSGFIKKARFIIIWFCKYTTNGTQILKLFA